MDTRFQNMTLRDVLIQSLQKFATRIYLESQNTVPVKTGRLKGSGSLKYPGGDKVAIISYDTPYAQMVNRTQSSTTGKQPFGGGDKTMVVSSHKRTYPSGKTVTVRKHTKNVGARPAGRGDGFLAKAVEKESKSWAETIAREFPDVLIVKGLGNI